MSAKQLLEKLQRLGSIDAKTLAKLRKQIEDPSKNVSSKAVIKYLVDNKFISRGDGELLLQADPDEDKPDSGQATVAIGSRKKELDTDDLLGDQFQVSQPAEPERMVPNFAAPQNDPEIALTIANQASLRPVSAEQNPFLDAPRSLAREEPFAQEFSEGRDFMQAEPATIPTFSGKKLQSNPWESKWLFIGFGLLALLILTTVGLWWFLTRTTAEEAFAAAEKKFSEGNFPAARDAYLDFVERFRGESKIPVAKAKSVNALLRAAFNTNNWGQTKKYAVDELPKLLEDENNAISEIQDDLTVILPKTALGLSLQAVEAATIEEKQARLADSDEVMRLIENPAIFPASRLKLDYVQPVLAERQKNLDQVLYEVRRENDYQTGLVKIGETTEAGDTNQAAQKYHELVRTYPILKTRQPLVELVSKISAKESQLVIPVDIKLATSLEDVRPKSLARAMLFAQTGEPVSALQGKSIVYLINGTVYGLSAADGSVLWSRHIGFESSIQPQWVGERNRSDLIICDQSQNQILRLSAMDGRVAWRTEIGESFVKPAVTRDKVFVTTIGGNRSKIIRLNIDNGQFEAGCQLPQLATVGPVAHADAAILYQAGQHSSLYIISQEDLKCLEVFYLGHQPDTIDVEPFQISGHLCVLVNFAQHCQAHMLGFKQRGLDTFETQPAFKITDGKVTQAEFRYGRSIILSSESGDLQMYELAISADGDQTTASMQPQIAGKFQTYPGIANYFLADRGDLYIANKGLTKYRIQRSQQSFELRKAGDTADTFIGPVNAFENVLVHLRRRFRSSMVTAAAVNAETLEEIWRTDFAAPSLDQPFSIQDRLMALSEQGDLFELTADSFSSGFARPQVRSTTVKENLHFDQKFTLDDGTIVLYGQDCDRVLAYRPSQLQEVRLSPLQQPANRSGGQPMVFGNSLLVPSLDGQVLRVNPLNGSLVGAPFQPAVRPNQAVRWTRPAVFAERNMFVIGTDQGTLYSVEAEVDKSLIRKGQLENSGGFVSPVVRIGDQAFAICREGVGDRIVSFNVLPELNQAATKTLEQPYAGTLMALDQQLLVVTADGKLQCFNPDLSVAWQTAVSGKIAGSPVDAGTSIIVAFDNGEIVRLDKASGQAIKNFDLQTPLASGPFEYNGNWYLSDQNGVIHVIEPIQ